MLRTRAHVVRQPPAHGLSVQNSLARHTGARFSVKRRQELTKQDLTTSRAAAPQGLAVTSSLVGLACLRHQINMLEQSVQTRVQHTPSSAQWLTVQGIGTIVAQTITLETGALRRFPTGGNSAAYGRGVDSTKSSHGKRTGTGTGKNGHPSLAWASREAAQFARRLQPEAQRLSQRQRAQSRPNTVWARQAVAPTLSRACDARMRDRVPLEATQALG